MPVFRLAIPWQRFIRQAIERAGAGEK